MSNHKLHIKGSLAIISLIAIMLVMLSVTACEDSLDTKIFSQISPDNFFKTEADFNAAVITLYSPFGTDWGSNDVGLSGAWYNNLHNANVASYLLRGELTTDELESDNPGDLDQFNWGPSTFSGGSETVYAKIRFVARATSTIENMSQSTSVPDEVKNRYIAQAKVLRAWMMYVLYDFFGPVNAKTDPATLTNTDIMPRPSDTEYTSQIEQDLTDAMPDLADKYNNDPGNWGRVSKGTARMVLLKLYMHTKQWDKAETVAKDIMNMGYALMPEYADIFKVERNSEIIFAIDCSLAVGSRNWYPQHLFPPDYASSPFITRGPGWYTYRMPWAFYDKYDPTDKRRNTTIIASYTNASGGTTDRNSNPPLKGPLPLKYTGLSGPGPEYGADFVIFRLGEVYLSLAEAINEQFGPTSEAYSYVNAIRARAGVNDFAPGMTSNQFRDALLDERGRELFSEGTRRQDLIRMGKFISNAVSRGKQADPWEVIFPIPSDVIIEGNGIITQNDGYSE